MTSERHELIIDRFAAACEADERVLASFVGGSLARGTADALSDLDLYLITTDEAYGGFMAGRDVFLRLLGEPLFIEDFDLPHVVFFILADGTDGELGVGRASAFTHIHSGPYRLLLDKLGKLEGVVFTGSVADPKEQLEALRQLLAGFWRDLSHFITALGRGQLWWELQLEALRGMAVSLSRLAHDFEDGEATGEPTFKVDNQLPGGLLEPLRRTFVPLEREALLEAAEDVVAFFRASGTPLAAAHGLSYPVELDDLLCERLARLRE